MLVLSRRKNEEIQIGDDIRLTVVSIRRGSVKLAIDAPRDVAVHRAELLQRIELASRHDASSEPSLLDTADASLPT